MASKTITQIDLCRLLNYDAQTGIFTWRVNRTAGTRAGDRAGNIGVNGYVQISLHGKLYRAHRLAWLYTYGKWPENELDHINRVRHDNRLVNIRAADRYVNTQNTGLQRNNVSGARGVGWHKASQRWRARISVNNKMMYLGYYDNFEQAKAAYDIAAHKHHVNRVPDAGSSIFTPR
jgi:hypothetical protein